MGKTIPGSARCKELYNTFLLYLPCFEESVARYGPFDRSSIKIEMKNKETYIFNYVDARNWGIQTYKNYIESNKETRVSER